MSLLSCLPVGVLLLAVSLLSFLYSCFFSGGRLAVSDKYNKNLLYNRSIILKNLSVRDGNSENQKAGISRRPECTTVAPESRFDCARDRVLSQGQCEQRGCCYAPLPGSTGPPWCFYPTTYPGYKMGPLTPTKRGQTATLTRTSPSYLPKDISILSLGVTEETADCLHITVSTPNLNI